jgi:hypothetical protein
MKTRGKAGVALGLGLFLVAFTTSCASTSPRGSTFLGPYAKNMQPGPEGGAKMRWLKPGVDFSKYNKLMVDSVLFYFAEDSEEKAIDGEKMKELTDLFNQEFVQTLNQKYPVVAEPGPGVARIRVAITNLKLVSSAVGTLSTITSVTPVGLGINLVKRGTTGTWMGSGMTGAEMMVLDTVTNDVIAVAADERAAGFTERYSELGVVKDAFKFWAERITKFLDEAHRVKR